MLFPSGGKPGYGPVDALSLVQNLASVHSNIDSVSCCPTVQISNYFMTLGDLMWNVMANPFFDLILRLSRNLSLHLKNSYLCVHLCCGVTDQNANNYLN